MAADVRAAARATGMSLATVSRSIMSDASRASLRFGFTRVVALCACATALAAFLSTAALPAGSDGEDDVSEADSDASSDLLCIQSDLFA